MRKRQYLLTLSALLAVLCSFGQQFSLRQAQDYAVQHSYTIQERSTELSKAKARVNEVISSGLPQVNGSAAYQNFLRQPVQVIPAEFFGGEPGTFQTVVFGTKQNLNLDVTASQLLFDGSYLIGLKAAREVVQLSSLQRKLTLQEVRKQVYDAYAMVLAAEDNYETLTKSSEKLEELSRQTGALEREGLTDNISVSQIQINLANIKYAVENAATQIILAENLLKYTMGYPLDSELILSSKIDEFTQVKMEDFLQDQYAPMQTTEFKLARQNSLLREYQYKADKASYLPTLSAFFNHQQNAFRQEFSFFSNTKDYFTTNLVGVNLSVPIFTSFRKRNEIKQSKIDLDLAKINETKVGEAMKLELSNAQATLKNELNNFRTQESNLELSERIREQTRTKFSEGLASSFDLNQAETQFLQAQASYTGALINLCNAKSNLEKLLNK